MLFSVHENPDPQCSDIRDHDHHLDLSSSSSTFSIRDYVFSARSKKDIKTSWPFSLKNLKLCLKHGVKDVLPPFQSVEAIRNQVDVDPPQRTAANDKPVKPEKAAGSRDTTPTHTLFPSTITTVSQSESARPSHYRQPRGPANKSRYKVIVNSSEDIASNSTTQLSEAMASKICPVCKTFSSSSNTTLNAHIDQCLSTESSTPKWTLDSSKVGPRHRVKPRKTRLMVDIYVTAFPCTLEDLDRRNGSNWASNFPCPDMESEDKCDDVDAVYINSNGIKVRILSKPEDTDEPRVSKLADHLRPRKKKRHASKLSHYLKLAQTKKLQVCGGGGGGKRQLGEGSYDVQQPGDKTGNSETLRHWARSKRSGLAKKLNHNPNSLPETCRDLIVSSPENNQSGPENIFYEAQGRHAVEKDATWSSLAERSLTPMKRPLRKERTPRMLKSASFSMPVPDPVDTYDDSSLPTSIELHRSKSMRVSSVRNYTSCAVTEPKSDVCLRRDEERVLPWNSSFGAEDMHHENPPRRNTGRKEVLPFHQRSHRDYHCRVDPINVSRFSTKVAVDETLSNSHKPLDSEMLTGSSGPSFVDGQEQEMFYGIRLGNDMLMQSRNSMMVEDLNASFPDVDPIPIPGPPGSFLPSPRDMSSEDFQANSSLTTSRVQSSLDQRDGDSSDSPVSATSTVSNSTASRYDDDVEAVAPLPSSSEARNSGIRSAFSHSEERLFKMGMGFQSEGEPCCCQRKERGFHDRATMLNMGSQESQLLKRRMILGSANVAVEARSERVVVPARIETISPSNPVLRLMGKNLMVGNRDQDTPQQPPFARQQHGPESPVVPAGNGWARVDPSSLQSGQPHSHMYKCQNSSLL